MLRLSLAMLIGSFVTHLIADDVWQPSAADSTEWKSLFNGENLDGWDGDSRLWSVVDGVIHGETTTENPAKGNTFLIWKGGNVNDFEMSLSFRCNAVNNSGIMYRSEQITNQNPWSMKGYQHEIRNEEIFPNVSSFIYEEKGKRGRICLVGEKAVWTADGKKVLDDSLISEPAFKELMKVDDWNHVTIIAKGNRIQHYLNGKLVVDFTDEHPELARSEGKVGLQLHAGKPMWAEFKDIRLRELNSEE
ncbi:hypothetical protein Q31b_14410 [Novipirellula aureliae]|uniref:3-keto-alpha-glucoside-1,2-lyase/3-keto-2-hydroxy-glucal hydratase domain-containing protein n=1 Tax=Novipirellula aureliae TaxID=2527966 RepID=A0A5C6E9T5_9BACT|nr:DUF1080 domain-containing protein [Novipirellula aureliae]TWU43909.1 hypothetical protein Q31b_14410 [Novipirellula aureliae]